jgi:hypothetical protein
MARLKPVHPCFPDPVVKQPALTRHHPRCGCFRASSVRFFDWLPPKGRSPSSLPKEGAERRKAQRVRALARSTGPACEPVSPYGAPLRRFQSLGPRLPCPGFPAAFATRTGGRRKERALGVIMRREADPRTPGTAVCENRGRRRRSSPTLRFACRAPLCGWG